MQTSAKIFLIIISPDGRPSNSCFSDFELNDVFSDILGHKIHSEFSAGSAGDAARKTAEVWSCYGGRDVGRVVAAGAGAHRRLPVHGHQRRLVVGTHHLAGQTLVLALAAKTLKLLTLAAEALELLALAAQPLKLTLARQVLELTLAAQAVVLLAARQALVLTAVHSLVLAARQPLVLAAGQSLEMTAGQPLMRGDVVQVVFKTWQTFGRRIKF